VDDLSDSLLDDVESFEHVLLGDVERGDEAAGRKKISRRFESR
jgi:hypothetical protein